MFSAGRGLRIRMYVAVALNAVLLAALLAGAAWLATTPEWWLLLLFAMFAAFGVWGVGNDWRKQYERVEPVDVARAERIAARLCLAVDAPVPEVIGESKGPPLSWTTAAPGRRPRVHVTKALLDTLDDVQLAAVVAHELSHIANRDAAIMTVLATPGVYVLRGIRVLWEDRDSVIRSKATAIMLGAFVVAPAAVSAAFARILSRHRELAADRGAALLTGSPAAMSSALLRISSEIAAIPQRDLRAAAATDLLHVVPVRPERGIARLWATHPRMTTRVRELERLEARLQA